MTVPGIDDAPPCPPELRYLWGYFSELSLGLSSNGMGPATVTWEALRAWTQFMRLALAPWEARALVQLGVKRAIIQSEDLTKHGGPPQDRQHRA